MHQQKNILLGIAGGIAAYKAPWLVRLFITQGMNVKVVMTQNATRFITPLTMRTVSGNNVYTDMFQQEINSNVEHIALACWADALVIAPGTANFIARLAHGLADDLLSTICLATTFPLAIASAMNKEMWHAAITQEKIAALTRRGFLVFGPAVGIQACGDEGVGRMLEVQEIVAETLQLFAPQSLVGKKVVITAGPTQEPLDPIRYISNHSSGKMGYALAKAAKEAGAQVVLLSGPTNLDEPYPNHIKTIKVRAAKELHKAVMQEITACDIFIVAAAVADYRPVEIATQKIKKESPLAAVTLERNPDIVKEVANLTKRPSFVVGFAAETENLLANARKKLVSKNLDIIVANQIEEGNEFYSDVNAVTVLGKDAGPFNMDKTSKDVLARKLIEHISMQIMNKAT